MLNIMNDMSAAPLWGAAPDFIESVAPREGQLPI